VLGGERPQTIALVLSHLPPVRAGAVLSRLPENVQVDVIHRLVDLEETDPAILREVEEALRARLSQQVEMQRRRVSGLHAVAGILKATDGRMGMQILDNLAHRDRDLAEKLGPRAMRFDDLADLDEKLLAAVFEEAGPDLILPALFGAAPELVDRMLAGMSPADARSIRHELDHPGPIRLRDVEEARRQIARIATRMTYRTGARN
jgi:flagellar motor switch protein FliG